MYSFNPTEEQTMLIDSVKRFAENELRPVAHDADENRKLPMELVEKGWQLGIVQASIPEQFGGFGERSAMTGVLAAEELAWGDLSGALAILAPGLYALPILLGGTDEQKESLISVAISTNWKPYVSAIIEPQFDFSPLKMQTTAVRNENGYTLQGRKVMVPFAENAESLLVFASLDETLQAFVVSPENEGLEIGEREDLLGIQALPTFGLSLKDVSVPLEARIGGENGFDAQQVISSSNVAIAALGVGLSRGAYEFSRDYAKEREAFGGPIAQKQSIAFMLAEMATEIEAIRLMVWEAAWMLDNDKDASRAAYLALTGVSDMAMMVTDRAVQILGGHGYIRDFPVERWMRNGRGIPNFPGMAIV